MTWASFILALLKLATSLVGWMRDRNLIQQGQDQAIAKASLEVLEATASGKEIRERIRGLDDDSADALWSQMIEPRN